MTSTQIILLVLAAALVFGARAWLNRDTRPAGPQPKGPRQAMRRGSVTSEEPQRTVAVPLEWSAGMPTLGALGLDARHAKVRDRYVAARFPGVLHAASD